MAIVMDVEHTLDLARLADDTVALIRSMEELVMDQAQ